MSQVQQVQSAQEILRSLGITGQTVVRLPTGEFTGGGFVGPLSANHLYSVGVEGEEIKNSGAATVDKRGEWGWYYFFDKGVADAFGKDHGAQYASSAVHLIQLVTRKVIASEDTINKLLGNTEETKGFGEIISGQTSVRTLGSKKYRHEWQLIGFPALVHAAAVLFGFDVPEFDVSELRNQDTTFTDELFAKLCGNPDAKKGEEGYYTESVYYRQRADLWAALGESDPTKCHVIAEGTKHSTESPQLDACFQIALSNWLEPIYGRLRLVADPRVDALAGSGNRLNLGIVTDLYPNEAKAREAAASEQGDEGSAVSAAVPPLPTGYQELENGRDIWEGEVERTKSMAPAVAAAQVGADVSEVIAWREYKAL